MIQYDWLFKEEWFPKFDWRWDYTWEILPRLVGATGNTLIAAGEMVSVIGPSGSWQTAVLRMLMTLEQINGGVIYVDGKPLTLMEKNGILSESRSSRLIKRNSGAACVVLETPIS